MTKNFYGKSFSLQMVSCEHFTTSHERGEYRKEREIRYYEIELVTGGKGYYLHDGERCYPKEGDVLFRRPGNSVYVFLPYDGYSIAFSMCGRRGEMDTLAEALHDAIVSMEACSFPASQEYPDIYILFRESQHLFGRGDWLSELALQSNLLKILYYFFKGLQDKNIQTSALYKKSMQIVEKIEKYLKENYMKNIKLEELAAYVNISGSHLGRLFKKVTGVSTLEYLIGVRLYHARTLLVTTDLSIKEVSYTCGFDTTSYFCTIFKKKIGVTPQQYRMRSMG